MKKYYIKKKNIIGFIVGVMLCTGTFVYAAVTFPSNEVTYDNTKSGLSSTNVKGAIDELYTECTTKPAGEQIIEDNNLEKDEYECRYFFTGTNPNNYITFNNESWRILSVECDGNIKIIKKDNIGNNRWDTERDNNWDTASLNSYLNGTYYNSLSIMSQNQIVTSDFSTGGIVYQNNDIATQIKNENAKTWNGKIALPTVSEYIRTNSNKSKCGTLNLNNNNYNICRKATWLDAILDRWTLTPYIDTTFSLFIINASGIIDNAGYIEKGLLYVYPTLYLSSNVKIISGDGTQNNPYQIK